MYRLGLMLLTECIISYTYGLGVTQEVCCRAHRLMTQSSFYITVMSIGFGRYGSSFNQKYHIICLHIRFQPILDNPRLNL